MPAYTKLNLDNATDSALEEIASGSFPVHEEVSKYAKLLIAARKNRMLGNVEMARRIEIKLDIQYGYIPERYQW